MNFKKGLFLLGFVTLVGCQNTPDQRSPATSKPIEKNQPNGIPTPDGVKIIPYDRPEIITKPAPTIIVPKQEVKQKFEDGTTLPAYKNIIKQANQALKSGQWDNAEKYALHAQRLAPQASEPFFYLALIANHKNQFQNAESLAKRGLSYAQTKAMKRELWKVILKSAQSQKNNNLINEAQTQLKSL